MTWIKQNPDSFELLARKNLGSNINDIDFTNPRIICLAQEYSIDDKCLALSLGAELWKYRYYENDMLIIIREEEPEQLIKGSSGKPTIEKIKKELRKARTTEEHLKGASDALKKLFYSLDERIMGISSDIEKYTTQAEILYKTSLNFACLAVQNRKDRLRYLLRTEKNKIDDPKHLTLKIPITHGYGNITRQFFVSPSEVKEKKYSIEDVIDLLKQSYNSTQ
jgi:predicted transport protein